MVWPQRQRIDLWAFFFFDNLLMWDLEAEAAIFVNTRNGVRWSTAMGKAERLLLGIKNRALSVSQGSTSVGMMLEWTGWEGGWRLERHPPKGVALSRPAKFSP